MTSPLPAGACDCHVHVFGPFDLFPPDGSAPYAPPPAPVEDLSAMHRGVGIDRVVVVQPSVYGTDNACASDALARIGPSARGVAVVGADASAADLSVLDAIGFRGVRLNFGATGQSDPGVVRSKVVEAAEQVADLGWHVQVFARAEALSALHDVVAGLPAPIVVDHFGMPEGGRGPSQPAFRTLVAMVETGRVYVKLSGAYLLSADREWSDAAAFAGALLSVDPSRLLWGSNWPHPGGGIGASGASPGRHPRASGERVALDRLADWAGDQGTLERILVRNPATLYGFEASSDRAGNRAVA